MSGNGSDASRRFGSAEQAVVVKALDKGASVAAAARAAGFCVSTLYNARERCAVFRDAWDAAVEASGRPRLVAPRGERRWQAQRARRNRFTRERKTLFLAHFAATCDATASADEAGVCTSTDYEHRRTDAAFAEGWQEALEQGYARLEAEVLKQRLVAMARVEFRGDKEVAGTGQEFDRAMHLLREHKRGLAGVKKAGRAPTVASNEKVRAALVKRLQAFGVRVSADMARGRRRHEGE
ncbi:hypothetical protein [Allosphingosinicella sp.]|uniref:hypothetical protein n=1 Tax=Allosphingosinicella sp. TaxID=2823234 RepID=UPI002FC1BF98